MLNSIKFIDRVLTCRKYQLLNVNSSLALIDDTLICLKTTCVQQNYKKKKISYVNVNMFIRYITLHIYTQTDKSVALKSRIKIIIMTTTHSSGAISKVKITK